MKNCPLCQNPMKKIEKGNLTIYKCDQCSYADIIRRQDAKKKNNDLKTKSSNGS